MPPPGLCGGWPCFVGALVGEQAAERDRGGGVSAGLKARASNAGAIYMAIVVGVDPTVAWLSPAATRVTAAYMRRDGEPVSRAERRSSRCG